MADIANPHDRFFKEMFSRPEVAADFLANYLPPAVAALLDPDLDSLELTRDSFVDPDLRPHYADLLYRVRLLGGRPAFVYVLLEHKSYPDSLVALQLLGYMVRIWQQERRRDSRAALVPIIPIVVYHGRAAWAVPPGFAGLFDGPEVLRPYWPDFEYRLADLSLQGEADLRGEAGLRLAVLVLRHVNDERIRERLPAILTLVLKLPDATAAVEFLFTIRRYLSQAAPGITEEAVDQAARTAFLDPGDSAMTTVLESWFEESRQKGLQQGLQEGLQEGMQQGERAGLLAGIELALDLRFGAAGLVLMPEVRAIGDVGGLHAVHAAIRTARTIEDVRAVYSAHAG